MTRDVSTFSENPDPCEGAEADLTFALGITMAGAVSAGAYVAGALDVFLDALLSQSSDQDAAASGKFKVVLKTMSGTSGGGATAALSVPAVIQGRDMESDRRRFPLMYQAWVTDIDMLSGPTGGLVGDTDLRDGELRSLLNSDAIDAAITGPLTGIAWTGQSSPYIAQDLEIFITTTNTNGFAYQIPFEGSAVKGAGYAMANHAFVAHFNVKHLGSYQLGSDWLELWKDQGVPLHLDVAATPDRPEAIDFTEVCPPHKATWGFLRDMGVATAAFPVGLSARKISVTPSHLGQKPERPDGQIDHSASTKGGALPLDIDPISAHVPLDAQGKHVNAPISFVAADGGTLNNEPFEYAEYCLMKLKDHGFSPKSCEEDNVETGVIMIDPFPEGPTARESVELKPGALSLLSVVPSFVPTFMQHVRFKPALLDRSARANRGQRYLVMPSRTDKNVKYQGSEALASGTLGGFGGFFDQSFREHDYQLGRHNAYSFLSKHFTMVPTHSAVQSQPLSTVNNEALILPPLTMDQITQPIWPRISLQKFERLVHETHRRLLSAQDTAAHAAPSFGMRVLINVIRFATRRRLHRLLLALLGAELIRKDQLIELKALCRLEREVLAVLFKSPEQSFTAEEVVEALKEAKSRVSPLDKAAVEIAFNRLFERRDEFKIKLDQSYPARSFRGGYRLT